MGSRELIESLRKECDKKIEQIMRDAETLSEEIKGEASRRIEHFREDYMGLQSSEIKKDTVEIITEAEKRVRSARLVSERELSDRLYELAVALLGRLRDKTYNTVFSALVRELPGAKWKEVTVNPEDVDLARTHFPDAEIISDNAITGGLEAIADNGGIRVVNSFEKRLEKAWHAMLPILLSDVYEEFAE